MATGFILRWVQPCYVCGTSMTMQIGIAAPSSIEAWDWDLIQQ